jgi:hypothetical protein
MRTNLTRLATLVVASATIGLPFSVASTASATPCYEYNRTTVINQPPLCIPFHNLNTDYSSDDSSPPPPPPPGQPGQGEPGQPGDGDGQPGQPGQPGHGEPGQPGKSVPRSEPVAHASADPVAGAVVFSVAGMVLGGGAVAYVVRRRHG